MERLLTGLEARAEGRTLTGTVIRFGDISPSHRERFEAIEVPGAVTLNLDHSPLQGVAYSPGGGLTLIRTPDALKMRAEVPPTPAGELALHGARSGRYRGLSVEFRARRDRREGGLRVIESADLHGIGLVARPSYPASADLEARQVWYGTTIPVEKKADCRCTGQLGEVVEEGAVSEIEFDRGAFDDFLRGVRRGDRQVSAIARGAGDVVADTRTGSLQLSRPPRGGLRVQVRPLDTAAGRQVTELIEQGVEVHARPVIDFKSPATSFRVQRTTAVVDRADFRYVLVKPTDRAAGLTPLAAGAGGPEPEPRGYLPWL